MVTVAGMGAKEHRRADHASYIAAVSHSLEARDIQVADVSVNTSPEGRREAALLLRPDEDAFAERVPGQVRASWDETRAGRCSYGRSRWPVTCARA
jgi:hypothetical protein